MTIKKVITSGCSFAELSLDPGRYTWPEVLEHTRFFPSNVIFEHTGLGSQGNELIQKKVSLALIESLEKYKPEEIVVIVSWSGTERKAFYVDSSNFIKNLVDSWDRHGRNWDYQLRDLKNNSVWHMKDRYNRLKSWGGWYIENFSALSAIEALGDDCDAFAKQYFNLYQTLIGPAHLTLENIIMLQNLCKLKNVKLYQTFYRSYVFEDIEINKNHLNLNYLYKQLDFDTIVSTTGITEHLRPIDTENHDNNLWNKIWHFGSSKDQYFLSDGWHPNPTGARKWLDEVLIPRLKKDGVV